MDAIVQITEQECARLTAGLFLFENSPVLIEDGLRKDQRSFISTSVQWQESAEITCMARKAWR